MHVAVCVIYKIVLAKGSGAYYTIVHKSLTNLFFIWSCTVVSYDQLITIDWLVLALLAITEFL